MITNLNDLDQAIAWLVANQFKCPSAQHLEEYKLKVMHKGFPIVCADPVCKWHVYAEAGAYPPLHDMFQNLYVAPWVVDQVKRLNRAQKETE